MSASSRVTVLKNTFLRTLLKQQWIGIAVIFSVLFLSQAVKADEETGKEKTPEKISAELQKLTQNGVPLNQQKTLFLDLKEKCLYLQGKVVLDAGLLEMLCCREQSKEHESIISVNCKAYPIHAGLLALKAEPGKPVSFDPEFKPPSGEKIDISVIYVDTQGKLVEQDARKWVRTTTRRYFIAPLKNFPLELKLPEEEELRYDHRRHELLFYGVMKPKELKLFKELSKDKKFHEALDQLYKISQPRTLEADWVFAGSMMQVDPDTKEKRYLAEVGDYICVANFSSAMIDVAISSSASDNNRGFEANTALIPRPGTFVILKLQRHKDSKK